MFDLNEIQLTNLHVILNRNVKKIDEMKFLSL